MSADQTQREINQLDNKIAALEKKRANIEQKEADRSRKINDIQRSITKNTSASTLSSKSRQVQGYQNEIVRFSKDKAGVTKKIADKRKSRADKAVKLQKEEIAERQKNNKAQQTIQRGYERRIDELNAHIRNQVFTTPPFPSSSLPFYSENDSAEYDVFISHAWEDKKDFVEEFVNELTELGVKPWYDKQRIKWGDSMRAKIDAGLAKSKFGIVIISPNYIADGKYWTKAELDGLFQLESINGKTILPIWHNITKKEVIAFSSIIAGRIAMTTASMTPKEIAVELVKLLEPANLHGLHEKQFNKQVEQNGELHNVRVGANNHSPKLPNHINNVRANNYSPLQELLG